MTSNSENEARHKHAQSDQHRSSKSKSQPSILMSTLKSNKGGKNNKRGRYDITYSNAIEEDSLGQPCSKDNRFSLYDWDCGVCSAKGEASSD